MSRQDVINAVVMLRAGCTLTQTNYDNTKEQQQVIDGIVALCDLSTALLADLDGAREAIKTAIDAYPYERCDKKPTCEGCEQIEKAEQQLAKLERWSDGK
jgi:hypothetical protein